MDNRLLVTESSKRSNVLIANFEDGFADGWYMAVKECFRMELDIKLTERKKNKIAYNEWTQGPYYCFSEGQIFYDTRDGYVDWGTAINKVKIACQIISAKPNSPIKFENELSGKTEFKVLEGFVKFLLFSPNEERTKLVPYVGYNLTQNEFIKFLKTGAL